MRWTRPGARCAALAVAGSIGGAALAVGAPAGGPVSDAAQVRGPVAAASPASQPASQQASQPASQQASQQASQPASSPDTRVIVRAGRGGLHAAEQAVGSVGGQVTRRLPIVAGVAASVPSSALGRLRSLPTVTHVSPDQAGRVMAVDPSLGYDPAADTGAMGPVSRIIRADAVHSDGVTGQGVDVAVVDTGVSPVKGLTGGNLVNGPDLSFDSQRDDTRYRDGYGHGTHMAGIIAGRDASNPKASADSGFAGIAPGARIVNVKVGASDGAADVSQVIAAINWVTENRNRDGLNIRVLNLSYGTDGSQSHALDPLSYAAEVAWRKGIVVVVAAGNDGTTKQDLANPALNPNLLAVGASDPMGTAATGDDTLPDFSNRGTNKRYVDVVAPGVRLIGLRAPGSAVDTQYSASRVGSRFTRGSGTSQATAVVSGAAALLLSAQPSRTPDQVKSALVRTATAPPTGTPKKMGAGIVDVSRAATLLREQPRPDAKKAATYGSGKGSLEKARGSAHVTDEGDVLTGERDIFGQPWTPKTWGPAALAATTWNAGRWNGSLWTGAAWNDAGDWQGRSWVGDSWSGRSWVGRSWVGRSWVARTWDGRSWVGSGWASASWQ